MNLEIRPVREDELPAYIETISTAFLERPDVDKVAADVRTTWDLPRTLAAFDAGRLVGTFRGFGTEVTVPGLTRLPATAVSAVTVLPTHRRRGILRAMVAAGHAASRERGDPLCILHAAEYPIYGRFGYGPGTLAATWTLDTRGTAFRRPGGGVDLVRPADARAILPDIFDAVRFRQAGEIARPSHRWDFELGLRPESWGEGWKGHVAIHRDGAGTPDGYVRYRAREKWEERQPRGTVSVDDIQAASEEAYGSLWRFLAELDLVVSVKAEGRRHDERLPWLLVNGRAAVVSDLGDGLWVRLLDVPRALEARAWERSGSLVLEIVDADAHGGRMRVALDVSPDGAFCGPTSRPADLTLDVAALGAAYLGGSRLRDAVLDRGADEHRGGALAQADALFRTAEDPYCSTFF